MMNVAFFFFFKQKTAYEMRISDWSSDVCSSDLTMFQCTWERADAALQFSEHSVPPFRLQGVESCRKELLAPFRSVAQDRRGQSLPVCVKLRHGILAID